jgi:hypothetical protein
MGEAGRGGRQADIGRSGERGEEGLLGALGHLAGPGEADLQPAAGGAHHDRLSAGGAQGGGGRRHGLARTRAAGDRGLRRDQGGVPLLGEGGMAGAALGEGGAVAADRARGEPGIAGAGERGEEARILERLRAGEGSRHPHGLLVHVMFSDGILLVKSSRPAAASPPPAPREQRRESAQYSAGEARDPRSHELVPRQDAVLPPPTTACTNTSSLQRWLLSANGRRNALLAL